MEEQIASFFEEFSKKPKSGKRQFELLQKYVEIQNNPKALEDFILSFSKELSAPVEIIKVKESNTKPVPITKTSAKAQKALAIAKASFDTSLEASAPKEATSEEAVPKEATSEEAAPKEADKNVNAIVEKLKAQKQAKLQKIKEAAEKAAAEKAAAEKAAAEVKEVAPKEANENVNAIVEKLKAQKQAKLLKMKEQASAAAEEQKKKEENNVQKMVEKIKAQKEAAAAKKAEAVAKKAAEEAAAKAAEEAAAKAAVIETPINEGTEEDDFGVIGDVELPMENQEEQQIISDPDSLYDIREPPELATDIYPVEEGDTLSQGDCFFSAIFRYAIEQDFAEHLFECLDLPHNDEEDDEEQFVRGFRKKLADEILAGRLPQGEGELNNAGKPKDIYSHLHQLFETTIIEGDVFEDTDYAQVVDAQPLWLQRLLSENLLNFKKTKVYDEEKKKEVDKRLIVSRKRDTFYTRQEFLEMLAKHIIKPQSFVAETEYRIARRFLRECGYKLVTYYELETMLPKRGMMGDKVVPRINLWNQGEGHYVYFSFEQHGGGKRKAKKKSKKGTRSKRVPRQSKGSIILKKRQTRKLKFI